MMLILAILFLALAITCFFLSTEGTYGKESKKAYRIDNLRLKYACLGIVFTALSIAFFLYWQIKDELK